jgi:hypothetical protein
VITPSTSSVLIGSLSVLCRCTSNGIAIQEYKAKHDCMCICLMYGHYRGVDKWRSSYTLLFNFKYFLKIFSNFRKLKTNRRGSQWCVPQTCKISIRTILYSSLHKIKNLAPTYVLLSNILCHAVWLA